MKAYLVGGAIRNRLLGRRVRERDYVVVGATPELMEQKGFRSVGKDFPVFLHPQTNEEYALARTERKSGKGYKGFVFHARPDVTLEEDLLRRDFTVNAIAEDEQSGDVADPFHGRNDCASRILRHVSEAFVEDPLRVLRAARFVADLHLNLAPETEELIRKIVASGEIEYLSAERICTELIAGLNCERPTYYVSLLHEWGVFKSILPEADELLSLEQNETLNMAAANFWGTEVKLAALLHDERIPHDQDFAQQSADQIKRACERLRLPKRMHEQVAGACAEHGKVHVFDELSDEQVLAWFGRLGAFRRRDILECAIALAGCDYACRPQACMYAPHPMRKQILRVLESACAIDGKAAAASSPRPEEGVRAARLQAIAAARADA